MLLAAVAIVGCGGDDEAEGPTTTRSTPPTIQYTDCNAISAGDPVASNAPGMICKPGQDATLDAMDCSEGTYIRLIRPDVGDLEGITGAAWRDAGQIDPELGRTKFAFENCHES
jgi:hypothetical protein